jgi:pimeloyl-ACP methyl ester carboxylesterase
LVPRRRDTVGGGDGRPRAGTDTWFGVEAFMRVRRGSLGTAVAVVIGVAAGLVCATAATADTPKCEQIVRTVGLSTLDSSTFRLVGELCQRGASSVPTVQLLVHGLTYDHNYWDFAAGQSYVDAAVAAGYATFNIDRIGVGQSDRPPNASVLTTGSEAYVLHQLVQALRAGTIGGVPFAKVVTVGHSFGSQTVAAEAAKYGDVDGAILTGALHQTTTETYSEVLPVFHLAQLDPKFTGTGVPIGYLTTIPGTRGAIFFSMPQADPGVIATDEALKQTATDGEVATVTNGTLQSQNIDVPVLLAVGEHDKLFCNAVLSCLNSQAVLAREQGSYGPQACLEAFVLPGAGHSINLHRNAEEWFNAGISWIDRRVGVTTGPPAQVC